MTYRLQSTLQFYGKAISGQNKCEELDIMTSVYLSSGYEAGLTFLLYMNKILVAWGSQPELELRVIGNQVRLNSSMSNDAWKTINVPAQA